MNKDYKWYKIANTQNELMLSNEGLTDVAVNGQRVAIGLYKNTLYGENCCRQNALTTKQIVFPNRLQNRICVGRLAMRSLLTCN